MIVELIFVLLAVVEGREVVLETYRTPDDCLAALSRPGDMENPPVVPRQAVGAHCRDFIRGRLSEPLPTAAP